jgi:hypothetical protein
MLVSPLIIRAVMQAADAMAMTILQPLRSWPVVAVIS